MKDAFSNMHPTINFIFFAFAIGFTMFIMNPVCLVLNFFLSLLTALYLNGKKTVRLLFLYLLPMIALIIVINPVFNHEGITILFYLPWNNPLTLESVLYGAASAVMLSTAVLWFSSFNTVITSDKIVYLFGRIAPSFSLIISMALRFIPRFSKQMKLVKAAQASLGRDLSSGNILFRIRSSIKVFSITVSWSLENSIETSDSMKSRGHGLRGRTSYCIYGFDKRNIAVLTGTLALGAVQSAMLIFDFVKFRYFPSVRGELCSSGALIFYILYSALLMIPLAINVGEGIKWKRTQSKI